jgi:hypothetical protein
MATHKSVASLMRAQEERFRRMDLSMNNLHTELVRGAYRDAAELTGGKVSTRTLRQMGHPFGRIGGAGSRTTGRGIQGDPRRFRGIGRKGQITRGAIRPLPINKQTGELRNKMKLEGPRGVEKVYSLGSSAPYAGFVLNPKGTRKMIARGYFPEIVRRHKARKAAFIRVYREKLKQ